MTASRLARLRHLRSRIEDRLDATGWRWNPRLSALIDTLTRLEDELNHDDLTPNAFDLRDL